MTDRIWGPSAATGLGSLPGRDPVEASRLVLGEVPDLPYLPELPARGLGADMIGRTASLLVDLPVEWLTRGWTMTAAPGRDLRAARDWLRWDVDAITEQGQGVPVLKVQVTGPITLASSIELPGLHKVLTDYGALADLAASLAEGVATHVAEIAARMPGTSVVVQLDEPLLPAALAGRVPTPSGYGSVRSLDAALAGPTMASVLTAAAAAGAAATVVHCCAEDIPFRLIADAGAGAIAFDLSLLGKSDLDTIGELVDSDIALFLGVVPAVEPAPEPAFAHGRGTEAPKVFDTAEAARDRVLTLWERLGFNRELLPSAVVVTPSCGMAGATPEYARRVMARLRDVSHALQDASVS